MFFEERPWLLVPIIIVVVEAWTHAKALARSLLHRDDNWKTAAGPASGTRGVVTD